MSRASRKEGRTVRVRRSAAEARRVILDAAEKRLREGGPEAIRLQDIAGDVGVSHPAILHHFGSRAGLTRALQERAMANLRSDLLTALGGPAGSETAAAILDRVFATLGDSGHARLLVWHALANDGGGNAASGGDMLDALSDAIHRRRREQASEQGCPAPSREDSGFVVRLAAVAMLGDAIFYSGQDPRVQRRFRAWLAELIVGHLAREEPAR